MLRMEGRAAHGALAHARGGGRALAAARSPCRGALGERVFGPPRRATRLSLRRALGAASSAGPRGITLARLPRTLGWARRRGSPTMLALALFIAAGAPNAWALLVPARRVTRGSNRILSEASFEQFKLVAADAAEDDDVGNRGHRRKHRGHRRPLPWQPRRGLRLPHEDGATYVEVAKLTAADASSDDSFGWSVAIKGNTIVVGARGDDDGGASSGSAYVSARPTAGPRTTSWPS